MDALAPTPVTDALTGAHEGEEQTDGERDEATDEEPSKKAAAGKPKRRVRRAAPKPQETKESKPEPEPAPEPEPKKTEEPKAPKPKPKPKSKDGLDVFNKRW